MLDARAARHLPALMLARVDGKSPVEYLDEMQRAAVRAAALRLIAERPGRFAAVLQSALITPRLDTSTDAQNRVMITIVV